MNKSIKQCLTLKNKVMDQFTSVEALNEQELSGYTHQMKGILDKMCHFSTKPSFKSRRNEQQFYRFEVIETLAYYLYAREMKKLVFQMSWDVQNRLAFIDQKKNEYNQFIITSADYDAYCMGEYEIDTEGIQRFLKKAKPDEAWLFFDAQCPFFQPAYFKAINLVKEQLKRWVSADNYLHLDSSKESLWGISKTDLCLFVYLLYQGLDLSKKKVSILACAQKIGLLFNVKIGNEIYQIFNAKKNRSDLEQSAIGKGYAYLASSFEEPNK